MKQYDYYAVADRVKLIEERTALENLKRLCPDFSQYTRLYELWDDCVKRAERGNASMYIPLSLLMEYESEHEAAALNYAIVWLLKRIADSEKEYYLGIDYMKLDQIEKCLISAAEYLSKAQNFLYYDAGYMMHIRYRKDFHHVLDIYIVDKNGHLQAKVPTQIDDITTFQYELHVDDYPIPQPLEDAMLSCLNTTYRDWVLTQFVTEDDRCFMDYTFSIYVDPDYLKLPKTKEGWSHYNPIEYFSKKSAFPVFNQLLAHLYSVLPDEDRQLFPFTEQR
ncbi:MAG: hypothetical protein IKI45_13485 [Oscillospiraceae bacterium]|nr:hypothetical protein [Oscillospiraceae bacterium]